MAPRKRELIVVSNRLPIALKSDSKGWKAKPSSGGLASALAGVKQNLSFKWVGWPGADVPGSDQPKVKTMLEKENGFTPVFLDQTQIEQFYNGFCNSVIWPLFHYLPNFVDFSLPFWNEYKRVNEQFAEKVLPLCKKSTSVWVHDYQLFLLPQILRKEIPELNIGFFLHIPFPSSELYRLLPVREELLKGLLGSDLIGFQTLDYARHFASSCVRVLGTDSTHDQVIYKNRKIHFGTYPIGIAPNDFIKTIKAPKVVRVRKKLEDQFKGKTVILGVDRSDYIKGIVPKLQAFEAFLEKNPSKRKSVVLVQVAVPSREHVKDYISLKQQMDELVGRINGKYGTPGHTPIHYITNSIPFEELTALYRLSDIMLITSIRDGMNLVALEYTACQKEKDGVLILSEFAGAAHSLGNALFINPWDIQGVSNAISQALAMKPAERKKRVAQNLKYVEAFSSLAWARRFVRNLESGEHELPPAVVDLRHNLPILKKEYKSADSRLIFLDYDGTLAPFAPTPDLAPPSNRTLSLLKKLGKDKKNDVYLVSGRSRKVLDKWFSNIPIHLSAEHGLFCKEIQIKKWLQLAPSNNDWVNKVFPIFHDYLRRTPGSTLEKKTNGITWHFRQSDPELGEWQAHELTIHLKESLAGMPIDVIRGKKVVEVRPQGVNKGTLVKHALSRVKPDAFVLCFGDDRTDEDMFSAVPQDAWSCRVNGRNTAARFVLPDYTHTQKILNELSAL